MMNNGKIWCSFIDWDMYESIKALEDKEFQEFLHSILKLQIARPPQKPIITTPRRPLGFLVEKKEIYEEPLVFRDWDDFWKEFKNAQNERDKEKTDKRNRY